MWNISGISVLIMIAGQTLKQISCYFSPYSPDLNPIEECFSVGKAWLLRNPDLCQRYPQRCFEIALSNVSSRILWHSIYKIKTNLYILTCSVVVLRDSTCKHNVSLFWKKKAQIISLQTYPYKSSFYQYNLYQHRLMVFWYCWVSIVFNAWCKNCKFARDMHSNCSKQSTLQQLNCKCHICLFTSRLNQQELV